MQRFVIRLFLLAWSPSCNRVTEHAQLRLSDTAVLLNRRTGMSDISDNQQALLRILRAIRLCPKLNLHFIRQYTIPKWLTHNSKSLFYRIGPSSSSVGIVWVRLVVTTHRCTKVLSAFSPLQIPGSATPDARNSACPPVRRAAVYQTPRNTPQRCTHNSWATRQQCRTLPHPLRRALRPVRPPASQTATRAVVRRRR